MPGGPSAAQAEPGDATIINKPKHKKLFMINVVPADMSQWT
jgi:hypothetical protein